MTAVQIPEESYIISRLISERRSRPTRRHWRLGKKTPLPRNEWICWTIFVKKDETGPAACRKGVLGAQRRDAAAVLLAGLSASMSILWFDSRSERLFDATESVLGIGISGDSMPTLTLSFRY